MEVWCELWHLESFFIYPSPRQFTCHKFLKLIKIFIVFYFYRLVYFTKIPLAVASSGKPWIETFEVCASMCGKCMKSLLWPLHVKRSLEFHLEPGEISLHVVFSIKLSWQFNARNRKLFSLKMENDFQAAIFNQKVLPQNLTGNFWEGI
jgi:hypothetical protein